MYITWLFIYISKIKKFYLEGLSIYWYYLDTFYKCIETKGKIAKTFYSTASKITYSYIKIERLYYFTYKVTNYIRRHTLNFLWN